MKEIVANLFDEADDSPSLRQPFRQIEGTPCERTVLDREVAERLLSQTYKRMRQLCGPLWIEGVRHSFGEGGPVCFRFAVPRAAEITHLQGELEARKDGKELESEFGAHREMAERWVHGSPSN